MDTTHKPSKPKISTATIHHHRHHDGGGQTYTALIPGLPNHLAQLCLSSVHPSLLSAVCRPWRRLIYSASFPHFFSLYALLCPTSSNSLQISSLDPYSTGWRPLPAPPPLHLLHRHPSFISRSLPIQSLAVSGSRLVLLAASDHHLRPAITRPLVFDPLSSPGGGWSFGPLLPAPRRWCAAGAAGCAVYVASGVGSSYNGDVARSLEKWDMNEEERKWKWEKMAAMKNSRFSREAIEALEHRGKLYMVNMKGGVVKQGVAYDMAGDRWENMPEGMLAGWKGPAAADGGEMYVVDEVKGRLSRYDDERDGWEVAVELPELLKGAEQVAAGRGKVCVVCGGGRRIAVVDMVGRPPRSWVVEPPGEMEVVAVHILPRMSSTE